MGKEESRESGKAEKGAQWESGKWKTGMGVAKR